MTKIVEYLKKLLVVGLVISICLGSSPAHVFAAEHGLDKSNTRPAPSGGPLVVGSYHRDGTSLNFEWEPIGFSGEVSYTLWAQKPLGCGLVGGHITTSTSQSCEIVGNSGKPWGSCLSGEAKDEDGNIARFMFCLGSSRSFFDYRSGFDISNYWVGYVEDGSIVSPPAGLGKCFGDLTLSPIKVLCVSESEAQNVEDRIRYAQNTNPSWRVFPQPNMVWIGDAGDPVVSDYGAQPITSSLHIGEWFVESGERCSGKRLRIAREGQNVRYCAYATIYGPGAVSFSLDLQGEQGSFGSGSPAMGKELGSIDTVWSSSAVARYTLSGGGLSVEYEGRPFGEILSPPSRSQS